MLTPRFLQYMNSGSDGYVRADDVFNREILERFLGQLSEQRPEIDQEYIDNILSSFDILRLNFPESDSEIPEDLPSIDGLHEFEESKELFDIEDEFIDVLLSKEKEDFPFILDVAVVNGIIIGFEITDKKKNLEKAMDVLVENEEYERAANVRDELKKFGSSKVEV